MHMYDNYSGVILGVFKRQLILYKLSDILQKHFQMHFRE